MDEKKKRLLELIELLKFPLPPEESEKQMETMSEAEIDTLLEVYEDVYEYEKTLNEVAEAVNPEEYKKNREKFNDEILETELEYADKLEEVQKEADEKLESVEKKADEKVEAIVADSKKKFQEAEDITEDLTYGFKSAASEK